MTGSNTARPDVFVSYCRDDRVPVEAVVRAMEAEGLNVWWDARLEAGAAFDAGIAVALRAAKCVLVCWSNRSIESEWVRAEALDGRERGVLVSCALEACAPIPPFNILHHEDLSHWRGDRADPTWRRLVRTITGRRTGSAQLRQSFLRTPRARTPNLLARVAAIGALALVMPAIGPRALDGSSSGAQADQSGPNHADASYVEALLSPGDEHDAALDSGVRIALAQSVSEHAPTPDAVAEPDAIEGVVEHVSEELAHDSFLLEEDASGIDVSDPLVFNGVALEATMVQLGEQARLHFEIGAFVAASQIDLPQALQPSNCDFSLDRSREFTPCDHHGACLLGGCRRVGQLRVA